MSDTQTPCSKCSIHLRGGGVWCYGCGTYMHIKCSGLSTKNDHHPNFICKHCSQPAKIDPQEHDPTPSIETPPEPCDFWKNFKDEQIETLRKIYNEIVHWKPIFFTISKNKVGFQIADVMNIIFTRTLEDGPQTECAMICTMIMRHLLLARSKSENDASITKTLSKRLDLWIRCKFDNLFVEAKALQER